MRIFLVLLTSINFGGIFSVERLEPLAEITIDDVRQSLAVCNALPFSTVVKKNSLL